MLFLNSRTVNGAPVSLGMSHRSYTQKMGHSFIICGCFSMITGLILIVLGMISEIKKTTFIGIGVISLGVGFFLMTVVCLYGKLDICYNNWVYRTRVKPNNPEPSQTAPPGVIPHAHTVIPKQTSLVCPASPGPTTVISEVEINTVAPSPRPQTRIGNNVT